MKKKVTANIFSIVLIGSLIGKTVLPVQATTSNDIGKYYNLRLISVSANI
ncbi:MAG: hypothetical protein ACI33M_12620 [Lysinibacillus sp.]